MTDWSPIIEELALWQSEGLQLDFWWRDDDAVSHTPMLERLTELAVTAGVPCHLAIVPKHADQTLVAACQTQTMLVALVHGWAHTNRAPDGQKKAEFGHPRAGLINDATAGISRTRELFGNDFLPCFVPPWNRVEASLLGKLPSLGYSAVSTYTPRAAREAASDLVQINTHIDPINWKSGGGLLDLDDLMHHILRLLQDRRAKRSDPTEPLGLLTHHLVHDEPIWTFTKDFLLTFLDAGATPVNLLELKENLP